MPAGKRSRETKVTIHWLEREIPLYDGWPSLHECESMAVATIPVVPPGGTVGDPSVARLSGRFRILYRVTASGVPDVKKADHATWKLRPLCRYFGCFTKVRSSLGMRGNFWIPSNGRHDYELNWSAGSSARFGSCEGTWVNRFTGEVVGHWKIRRAFHEDLDIALDTVEEPETHRVKSFSGRIVRHYEPIRSAKRRGCHDAYIKERVRGQLIR